MTVRRTGMSRGNRLDLLGRPPPARSPEGEAYEFVVVDPVRQLAELADLCERGFLTRDEFELQKMKVLRLHGHDSP